MGQVILSHLQKTYPASGRSAEFRAVKDLSLTIEPGEFMVLVGPSGCGKSTTLRMIAGLESITSGTITIAGTTVNDVLPKDRGIAMVFQNYALYPHMTVRENISFGLKLAKTPRAEMEQRVNEAAKLLGLETMLDRKPAALSGGQRQRVALGRAIVRRPQVFLFDEPLSNLDAKMRVQMRAEISQLHDRLKATMIYVTHDQVEAMTMGDRICVMKDGEIQQVARPLELYHAPANVYVAGFIGSPPMNLLRGQLTRSGEAIHFTTGAVTIPLRGPLAEVARRAPSPEVVFGIRPEHVVVARAANAVDAELSLPLELAEPMGAETFLHFRPGAGSNAPVLIARVSGDETFVAGVTLGLSLTLAKAHLFDATTEKVLV